MDKVFPDNYEETHYFFENLTKPLIELFADAMENGELPQGNAQLKALLFYSGVLTVAHALAKDSSLAKGTGPETMFEETKRQLFYGLFSKTKN